MKSIKDRRVQDLVTLLNDLEQLYRRLLRQIERKIYALRHAKLDEIPILGREEQALVARIDERDGLRSQLIKAIASDYGWHTRSAQSLTITQIAQPLDEDVQRGLFETSARLRKALFEVAQANRIAGAIAREMNHHMKWVFDSVRPHEGQITGYSQRGEKVPQRENRLVDAVG